VPHLYLHVPFCARRCSYCDFSIAVRKRVPAGEYVVAIESELSALVERGVVASGDVLDTLYLGGGTPSLLPPGAIHRLLDAIREQLRIPHSAFRTDLEVTLEANPEDVTLEHATAWRRAGVNRVSLGAQSFDDRVLRWMHRSHNAARIGDAVGMLRRAGIDNVSLDLIFALPVELGRDWARDLDHALALEPSHLSLYGLTVEQRTPLARWISRGAATAPDDERYAAEYLQAHVRLRTCGYRFYEVATTRPTGPGGPTSAAARRRTRSTAACAAGTSRHGRRTGAPSRQAARRSSQRKPSATSNGNSSAFICCFGPTKDCRSRPLPPSTAFSRPGWTGAGWRSGMKGWCAPLKAGCGSTRWSAT